MPPCASASGGCEGGFQAHFAEVHHRVVESLILLQVLLVGNSGGEAIEQAEGAEVLTFVVGTADYSIHLSGHRVRL